MNRVVLAERLVPNIFRLVVEAPEIARAARPGQFVIVIPDEKGERVPINLADWDGDRGTIDLIFLNLGVSTRKLARFKAGNSIQAVVGPLGRPAEIGNFGQVLLVGGCYGLAGLYPLAKEFKQAGNKVTFLVEGRDEAFIFWEDREKKISDSYQKVLRADCFASGDDLGKIISQLKVNSPDLSRVVVMGCSYLLFIVSKITRELNLKTMVNLNPIMVDGTGMCGACRVTVNGQTYFACVDGPEFDGHGVDWTEYFNRRKAFLRQEEQALSSYLNKTLD